jgi:glycolate oxidase
MHIQSDAVAITRASLAATLRALLPAHGVLATDEQLRPYECDGLSAYRALPLVVVLPETIAQVQAVMRLCHELRVPVVARGAGTGLSGGAVPHTEGVVLSLAKLNRILEVDPINRSARVEPGVRNLAVSIAAAPHGLYYAPDPSSQIACSIGGNVAENSGGVHCLKYGLTVHNLLKLKVVLADGEIVTLGSDACDSAGYDLLALFTGSEGLLGIVVEVTVRLLPKPERTQVLLAAYATVAAAGQTVSAIIGAGIIPAGLEMMDQLAIRAAEDFVHVGYPTDAAAILLCEVDGTNEEVSEHVATIRSIMITQGATSVRTAVDDKECALLWKGRKAAFSAVGRLAPDYYCMDGTIPRRCLPQVLDEIESLSREYNLRVANVFHAGDGNLHPLILYDANRPGELHRAEQFGARILELCVRVGGTITGEHGVGIEKLDSMCVMFQPTELAQFFAVKNAFDPHGLLNPGKAIPSLHRCAELGAMHVHRGQVPFPDIERF